jgi:hypothetical protein
VQNFSLYTAPHERRYGVFNRYLRIRPMNLIQRNAIQPESPKASFERLNHALRTAVPIGDCPAVTRHRPPIDTELGCDDGVESVPAECFCEESLRSPEPIYIGGVKQVDSEL